MGIRAIEEGASSWRRLRGSGLMYGAGWVPTPTLSQFKSTVCGLR